MNRVHGDRVNAFAAQKAVETSGGLCRCIWMPTLDAAYQYRHEGLYLEIAICRSLPK